MFYGLSCSTIVSLNYIYDWLMFEIKYLYDTSIKYEVYLEFQQNGLIQLSSNFYREDILFEFSKV